MSNGVREKHIAEVGALMPAARAGLLKPKFRIVKGQPEFESSDHAIAALALTFASLEALDDGKPRPGG